MYSRWLSTRDTEAHLAEIYGVKVGRDLISKVTDGVMDDVRAWAPRPLEDVYPVIFLDALRGVHPQIALPERTSADRPERE